MSDYCLLFSPRPSLNPAPPTDDAISPAKAFPPISFERASPSNSVCLSAVS
jgi:hypothetical protein